MRYGGAPLHGHSEERGGRGGARHTQGCLPGAHLAPSGHRPLRPPLRAHRRPLHDLVCMCALPQLLTQLWGLSLEKGRLTDCSYLLKNISEISLRHISKTLNIFLVFTKENLRMIWDSLTTWRSNIWPTTSYAHSLRYTAVGHSCRTLRHT